MDRFRSHIATETFPSSIKGTFWSHFSNKKKTYNQGHFKYVTNISRKLFLHNTSIVSKLLLVVAACEDFALELSTQAKLDKFQKFNLAHEGFISSKGFKIVSGFCRQ